MLSQQKEGTAIVGDNCLAVEDGKRLTKRANMRWAGLKQHIMNKQASHSVTHKSKTAFVGRDRFKMCSSENFAYMPDPVRRRQRGWGNEKEAQD